MPVKNAMTAEFLRSAFGGESMAHMRYLVWAETAEKEGKPNVARVFRAVAQAEWVHAKGHFRVLDGDIADMAVTAGAVFGLKSTAENLEGAAMGEDHEVDQMYPAYIAAAEAQGEKDAVRTFSFALAAERQHAELFRKARAAVLDGKDIELEGIYVCPLCGHTVLDGAPDKCPVCGMGKDRYERF
jgi:rubrerythrin